MGARGTKTPRCWIGNPNVASRRRVWCMVGAALQTILSLSKIIHSTFTLIQLGRIEVGH